MDSQTQTDVPAVTSNGKLAYTSLDSSESDHANHHQVKVSNDKNKAGDSEIDLDKDQDVRAYNIVRIAVLRDADCSCCPQCLQHKIPLDWGKEIKELLKLAWPTIITFLLTLLLSTVSIIFCGHLGDDELGGAAIAQSIVTVFGVCIGIGMATACDTLFSQTFGSKNKKRVGIILQQSFIIMGLLLLPIFGVLMNTEYFLYTFGIPPQITRLSGIFVNYLLPGLPAMYLFTILSKYLQSQSIVLPIVIIAAIINVINIPLHYVLIFPLKLNIRGAAIAQVLSQWSLAAVLIIYIWKRKLHVPTWPGWSMRCFHDWSHFIRLGAAGIFLVCLEMWALEFGVILSGAVGEIELASQAVVYQLAAVTFVFPFGMALATSVRVGNALGALERDRAKTIAKVSLICTWVGAAIIAFVFLALKSVLGRAFTEDRDVIRMVSSTLPMVALFQFFDSTAASCAGVMRGCGLQRLGAFLDAVGYYFIGFPIGITLMFVVHMGIQGLWWGYTIGAFVQGLIFMIAVYRINWDRQEQKAQIRAGVRKKDKALLIIKNRESTATKQTTSAINITYNPVNNEVNNKPLDEDEMDLLKEQDDEMSINSSLPMTNADQTFKLRGEILLRRLTQVGVCIAIFIIGIVGTQMLTVPYNELPVAVATIAPINNFTTSLTHFGLPN